MEFDMHLRARRRINTNICTENVRLAITLNVCRDIIVYQVVHIGSPFSIHKITTMLQVTKLYEVPSRVIKLK